MTRILVVLSCTAALGIGLLAYQASAQDAPNSPLGMAPTPYEPVARDSMSTMQRIHSEFFNHAPSYTKGQSIVELAKSQPQGITITACQPMRLMSVPSFFKDQKRQSDLIVVGTVVEKTSLPTENEQWIFTDYTLKVETVLFRRHLPSVIEGSTITVTRPGGNMLVNDREVFMSDSSYRPLPPGNERYLLFLKLIPESGGFRSVGPLSSFLLGPNGVRPLSNVPLPSGFSEESEVALSSDTAFLNSLRRAIRR